jgi:hypothetical protein
MTARALLMRSLCYQLTEAGVQVGGEDRGYADAMIGVIECPKTHTERPGSLLVRCQRLPSQSQSLT